MNKVISYAIIFGTRPEYLKVKSIIDEFIKRTQIHYKVIYIQQHTNIQEDIDTSYIRLPIQDCSVNTNRLCSIGEQILSKLPNYINDVTHVIVQGDTATAYYSALTAFQLNIKVIHIEAGLRTYDIERPYPEEAYRQMISRIASIHFTPHDDSSNILINERVSGEIYNVGNTILDVIKSYNLGCTMSNTVLITFHRRENIQEIPSIELKGPCNHKEFTQQIASSNFLITDSGGIQEEASFLGKHCIVLRSSTERTHIPKEYITVLEDYSRLDEIYEVMPREHLTPCNVYGYGISSEIIMKILIV